MPGSDGPRGWCPAQDPAGRSSHLYSREPEFRVVDEWLKQHGEGAIRQLVALDLVEPPDTQRHREPVDDPAPIAIWNPSQRHHRDVS